MLVRRPFQIRKRVIMSIAGVIDKARAEKRTLLSEVESKDILEEAGIPTARARLATTAQGPHRGGVGAEDGAPRRRGDHRDEPGPPVRPRADVRAGRHPGRGAEGRIL